MTNLISNNKIKFTSYPTTFSDFHKGSTSNFYLNDNLSAGSTQADSNNKTHKNSKVLLRFGLPTLIGVLACLFFTKGFQQNFHNGLEKLKDFLDYRVQKKSLGKKNKLIQMQVGFVNKINSFLEKSKSINNFNSLKDILFMRLMYKTKFTKAIHKSISRVFDNMSRKTVEKSYKKTEKAFQKVEKKFQELDEYILKSSGDETIEYKGKEYKVKELINIAKDHREIIHYALEGYLSKTAQNFRHEHININNAKLRTTFWDASFKDFWTKKNKFKRKEMWQTFIAEEQMKGDKIKLAKAVALLRNLISYNQDDKCIAISKLLKDLRKMIPSFDIEGYNQVKKLEWFAKNADNIKNNKDIFIKELNKLQMQVEFENIDTKVAKDLQQQKKSYVEMITKLLPSDEKDQGDAQELISIYYKLAPFEFSKTGALKSLHDAVKSFDKSAALETSEYFDKVRDLQLGSAPTDILTILLSTGLIIHDLLKANDKDKKTTVMLTSGIPLAGAVATSVISASKLVSGSKSIALGLVSGLILNMAGRKVDKYRKNKQQINMA